MGASAALPGLVIAVLAALCAAQVEQLLAAPTLHNPVAAPPWDAMPAMPTLAPVYNCMLGTASDWPEDQQTWCCTTLRLGCPSAERATGSDGQTTTPTPLAPFTTQGVPVWTWGDEAQGEESTTTETTTRPATTAEPTTTSPEVTTTPKPATTPRPTTTSHESTTTPEPTTTAEPTTSPPTTTVKTTTTITCESLCTVNGIAATCRDQIQQASLSDFLGSTDSCTLAQKVTAQQCPVCAGCPPHEIGCGILELATKASTTKIPHGDPCKAVCEFGGQPATCAARVDWSKEHVFAGKPKACKQAHAMVLGQCTVCNQCQEAAACAEATPAPVDEEIFDCNQGAAIEWANAKVTWCCEHHQRGCDALPRGKQVFFQRKVSQDAADADRLLAPRGRAFIAGLVGLSSLGGVVLFFTRSSASVVRRSRSVRHGDRPSELFLFAE